MGHLKADAALKIREICGRYRDENTPLMMILSDIQNEYEQRLPCPKPQAEANEIKETAREHGVSTEAIGAIGHQMTGAGCPLVAESIHGVAVALMAHIHDGPNTEGQSYQHQDHSHSNTNG